MYTEPLLIREQSRVMSMTWYMCENMCEKYKELLFRTASLWYRCWVVVTVSLNFHQMKGQQAVQRVQAPPLYFSLSSLYLVLESKQRTFAGDVFQGVVAPAYIFILEQKLVVLGSSWTTSPAAARRRSVSRQALGRTRGGSRASGSGRRSAWMSVW